MRQHIGPFPDLAFHSDALYRLGVLRRRGWDAEVRCLAEACTEIREKGADAIRAHAPNLFDVYRCGHVIAVSVTQDGAAGTILDFFPASGEVP